MKTNSSLERRIILLVSAVAFASSILAASAPPIFAMTINVGCDVNALVNAVNAANASAGADTLNLSTNCTYTLTTADNTDAAWGPNGLPIVTSDIRLNGSATTIARSEAIGTASFRIFQVAASGTLTLDGLTVRNGQSNSTLNYLGAGGGILNLGVLTLAHSVLENNRASVFDSGGGGGIYNAGTASISSSTFQNNLATGNGTGKAGGGAIFNNGSLNLTGNTFAENEANLDGAGIYNTGLFESNGNTSSTQSAARGGGLYNLGASVDSTNDTFSENRATRGGGICNDLGGVLNLDNAVFERNRNTGPAGQADGGALYNQGTVNINHGRFTANRNNENLGDGNGAAIYNTGTLGVAYVLFQENRAFLQTGGALYNSGDANILASTFAANDAEVGGTIYNTGKLKAVNSTLTGKTAAPSAGGSPNVPDAIAILNAGDAELVQCTIANFTNNPMSVVISSANNKLTLRNSIISNPSAYGQNCGGAVIDGGGNLRFPLTDPSCVGKYGNPRLGPLQDNGGPTPTMALALNSQAINAGVRKNVPAIDQRLVTRPQGKGYDSGAFELQAPTPAIPVSPGNGSKSNRARVLLDWDSAARVSWYRVIVRQDSTDGPKVVNSKVETTDFKTPPLEGGHWYYWHVKACSKVSCTVSERWRFRVQ